MKFVIIFLMVFVISCSKNNKAITDNGIVALAPTNVSSNLTSSVIFDQNRQDNQQDSQIIDFGIVKEGSISLHRIYLKNTLTSSLSLNISNIENLLVGSAFQYEKTNCLLNLNPNQICFIDIKLVNNPSLSYSPINLEITSISENEHFGKIVLVGQRGIKIPVKLYQFINIGQVINIADSNKSVRVYIRNEGDKVINPQINVPNEYIVSKTSCTGVLQKEKVCFIELKVKPNIDQNIIGVNKTINFDGSSFSIIAGVGAPNESIYCIPSHTNVLNSCIQTNQIRDCVSQPANSSGGTEETSNAGIDWSACQNFTCSSLYTKVGNVCIETNQSRACLSRPDNSNGGLEYTTDATLNWGACIGYSCDSTYTNVAGICQKTNQSRLCETQPSNSNGGFEYSNNGGVNWGSCSEFSCNSGYSLNGGVCKISLVNYGSYRAWSNNSYASSCNEYKNPPVGYAYGGDIGNGIYRIKVGTNSPVNVNCDMQTSPTYAYIETANSNLNGTKMLQGKQFIKLTTLIGSSGVNSNVQVIGFFRTSDISMNDLVGKPNLFTQSPWYTHVNAPGGYNYVGTHNWFSINQINQPSYYSIVFGNGVVGQVTVYSNGQTTPNIELAYIYYYQYNYTLWERP